MAAIAVNTVENLETGNNFEELLTQWYRSGVKDEQAVLNALHTLSWQYDRDTALHTLRMAEISAVLASECLLSKDECNLILKVAPLHDLGKIRISQEILTKAGSLNEDEWEKIKEHPQYGHDLLDHFGGGEVFKAAAEVALSHHEDWDGGGYPNGLKGSEIPLRAQIVALADVYDALASKRCYKEAWSNKAASDEIQSLSGTKFNPWLVERFVGCFDKIKEVKSRWDRMEHLFYGML